ncbi:hypothetical protein ACFVZC_37110 [Streptomyces marokkonensis]|uniref:Uncharacterized protein n=1 Tax=Streptomyces marokkonensis TaxID=324855 RepID=A0ABW6QI73_9ACTN
MVAAHPEAKSGVNQDVTRRVLAAAAEHWATWPDDPLVGFVHLPAVEAAALWMRDGDSDAGTVIALEIDVDAIGESERSRIFRARVKAEETLTALGPDLKDVITGMLHLTPGAPLGATEREWALDLLTRAFTVGRDASDPDVAAAYHLEEAGAYTATRLRTVQDGARGGGRDFTGGQSPTRVDLAQFGTPAGLVDAPWERGPDAPAPYLVRITPDSQDPELLRLSFDGDSYLVSTDEFLELMAHDLRLMRKELKTPVVLACAGPSADAEDLAERTAQWLGRPVWWTDFSVDLSGTGDSGKPVLTLHAWPALGGPPGADAWHLATPAHPTSPEDAPRILPAPVRRFAEAGTEADIGADAAMPGRTLASDATGPPARRPS